MENGWFSSMIYLLKISIFHGKLFNCPSIPQGQVAIVPNHFIITVFQVRIFEDFGRRLPMVPEQEAFFFCSALGWFVEWKVHGYVWFGFTPQCTMELWSLPIGCCFLFVRAYMLYCIVRLTGKPKQFKIHNIHKGLPKSHKHKKTIQIPKSNQPPHKSQQANPKKKPWQNPTYILQKKTTSQKLGKQPASIQHQFLSTTPTETKPCPSFTNISFTLNLKMLRFLIIIQPNGLPPLH